MVGARATSSGAIAYLVNEYPSISHTFIRREIRALEELGFEIQRIALQGYGRAVLHEEDREEQARTHYVLGRGVLPVLVSLLLVVVSRPMRFLEALSLAAKVSVGAQRPFIRHLAYLAEACHIQRFLQRRDARHVHAHFGTNSAEIAMFVNALGGPTYSFTLHGQDELLFGGLVEKVRRAAFVVAISSYGRGQLLRRIDYADWSRIKLVHCGLDAGFHEVPFVPLPDAPRLVCVARMSPEKGHFMLLEAAHLLRLKGLEFEIVLVGDGELRPQVEAQIERFGLRPSVRIAGWLPGDAVRSEVLAARGLILPSFNEGLPTVVMEAMALRRPVLATCVTGVPELVLDGKTGWLFPAGSAEDMAAAIEDFLATPRARLLEMTEAGFDRVIERHSAATEAAKLAGHFAAVNR